MRSLLLKFTEEKGNQYMLWKQSVLMTIYITKIKYCSNEININEKPYFTGIKKFIFDFQKYDEIIISLAI